MGDGGVLERATVEGALESDGQHSTTRNAGALSCVDDLCQNFYLDCLSRFLYQGSRVRWNSAVACARHPADLKSATVDPYDLPRNTFRPRCGAIRPAACD
jgi:hypothetical protein